MSKAKAMIEDAAYPAAKMFLAKKLQQYDFELLRKLQLRLP